MPTTQITGSQVKDGSVQRLDLDVSTSGKAVLAKIIAGTNITFSSTGPDAGTGDVTINSSGGGITSLGVSGSGQTGATQTLATGTSGTDFNISSSSNTHTFNIPDASNSNRGLVTTGIQTFAGQKTFSEYTYFSGGLSSASIGENSAFRFGSNVVMSSSTSAFLIGGSATTQMLISERFSSSFALSANASYASHLIGTQTITEASSGTHALSAQLAVKPLIINDGTATTTNYATLYIEAAASGTATITNNYTLWVDAGTSRFDGTIISNSDINVYGTLSGYGTSNFGGGVTSGTSGLTISPSVFTSSSGSHLIGGATNIDLKMVSASNINPTVGVGNAYATYVMGTTLATEATSGTHPLMAQLAIKPLTITNGAAATTNSATLYIENAASGAANNYALWVANGTTRLDGDTTVGGSLTVSSGIASTLTTIMGGSSAVSSTLYVDNTSTFGSSTAYRLNAGSTEFRMVSAPSANITIQASYSYGTYIIGANTITEASSGTHPIISQLAIKPLTITNGTATTTNSATLYIEDAATGATNNYALWVDAGTSRFDGAINLTGISNTSTSSILYYNSSTGAVTYGGLPTGSGVADADYGDITVSSTGTVWTIDNNTVTYAKMQDVSATQRLIGRNTAAAGDPEEVTATQVLDWMSSTQGTILYRGASNWAALSPGTSGQILKTQGAGANPIWVDNTRTIDFVIDGGGSALTTGSKGFIVLDYGGTISSWTILADASGSAVVDIKRATYANFPTTASIVGGTGNAPTLTSAQKNQATPSSWTSTTITSGDVIEFSVTSAATVTRVTVSLKVILS